MSIILRLLPYAAGLLATAFLGIATSGLAAYYYLQPALPSVEEMRDIQLQIPLRIYSRDGRLIEQIGEKRRNPVDYEDIPEIVVQAFLAAEDDRFFEHPGFDYQGIIRAGIKLITTGSRAQGGSTITQQLAREYFLTRDRTFVRKAKELILATQIESEFTKPEILSLYLNKIFLGQRAYGVAAAAEVYFGKTLSELSIAEAATIAGLPAAPSRLNPVSNPDLSRDRRSYVLRRMQELSFIDDMQYETAMLTPVESHLHGPRVDVRAPYLAEMARSEAVRLFGTAAYTDGYQVVTTIDSRLQRAASTSLRKALLTYDRRHGYRGAVAKADITQIVEDYENQEDDPDMDSPADAFINAPAETRTDIALQAYLNDFPVYRDLNIAIITALKPGTGDSNTSEETDPDINAAELFLRDTGRVEVPWDRLKWRPYINDNVIGEEPELVTDFLSVGDIVYLVNGVAGWQLAQLPETQGAFVALDPRDGATAALTGGFDYYASKFNRAVQTRRQPGSSFKPFIYSAALENGFTPATIINDAPVVLNNAGQEESWRPQNYSNRFYGPTRLREGLVKSMNLVSVRVLQRIGMRRALEHIKPFGFPASALPRDLALALGSGGASPWQMAEGFSGLASGGYATQRYFIDRILDTEGNIVYQATPTMVCAKCAPQWFDGREANEQQNQPGLPEFAVKKPVVDTETGDDTQQDAEMINLDPEVPAYSSAEEMIQQAQDWKPDYTETPKFWADRSQAKRIITAQNAYLIFSMMQDVINRGTGRRARSLERHDIGGKTGTSNNRRDAWFSGFNSEIVGIAWVGFDDDSRSLGAGEEGSRTALPMWIDFMATAIGGTEEAPLKQPSGIVTVRIEKDTGLLASAGSKDAMFEIFRAGNEPSSAGTSGEFGEGEIFTDDADDSSIF
jgi:penicillin-binding protein 1A